MKDKLMKYRRHGLFLGFLCIICAVSLFWCVKKSDMFMDETVTYGLANSYYAPFIEDVTEHGTLINTLLSREDFEEYLTVGREDAFSLDSVYYNQTQDTQPPLYYMLLHILCSFFPGQCSKWIGLSLNLILYILTSILLYQVGRRILGSEKTAALAVLVYGLSFGGLSTVLMIRMYILLTFFTVLFGWLVLKLYQDHAQWFCYPAVTLVLFLGLFTQYFFVFSAFFASAAYCLCEMKRGRWKQFFAYAFSAFAGLAVFYLSYPSVVDHLFADKLVSGQTSVDNMMDFAGMGLSIYSFVMQAAASYKAGLILLLCALAAGIIGRKKDVFTYFSSLGTGDFTAAVMTAAVIGTVVLTAVVSPVTALRYIYNVLPFVAVGIVYTAEAFFRDWERHAVPVLAVCAVFCTVRGLMTEPQYVETVPKENYERIRAYTELPCIYLGDQMSSAMTQDMFQLMEFPEVFATDDFLCGEAQAYLESKNTENGIVLYIDVSDWGSGYDSGEVIRRIEENTGYSGTMLCSFDFSETWLID